MISVPPSFCFSSQLRECGGDGLGDRGGGQAARVRGGATDQRRGQPRQPHQPGGVAARRGPRPADEGRGGRRDAGQRRGAHLAGQRHAECLGRRYRWVSGLYSPNHLENLFKNPDIDH